MAPLTYRDFELEIAPGEDGRYPVAVLDSPSGQVRGHMALLAGHPTVEERLAVLETAITGGDPLVGEREVKDFGAWLFDALFSGEMRAVYDRSRQAVADSGEGLRIKLRVNAPDLATLPWEFLYDPRRQEFIALSRLTPIVRYLELPLGETKLAVQPPLRILGLVASPADAPVLNVEGEKARLEAALRPLGQARRVELVWLQGQTWRDLQRALQAGPWHILHFSGHAAFDERSGEGVLLLADDNGRATPISAGQLGQLLTDHQTLRLAVLNACQGALGGEQSRFSSLAAALVQRGLPAVLAMQYEISDQAAIEFTASFYGALAANLPIDAAVGEARKAINLALANSLEWGTPVLFMRTPTGVLWDVQPRRRLPLAALATVAVGAIMLISLLLWLAIGQARLTRQIGQPAAAPSPGPTAAPAKMTGAFNIAVADFGAIPAAGGSAQESEEGRVLSRWLYDNLVNELTQSSGQDLPGRVEIWHDSAQNSRKNVQLGMIGGDSPAAREAAAAQLARQINATMVIYGNIVEQGDRPELQLAFYVSPALSQEEFGDILGTHRLGKPVSGPFDPADPLASDAANEQLRWRSRALVWLTMGLVQELRGQPAQALAIFQRAQQDLQDWPENDGKEILHFFTGREHFFASQLDPGAVDLAQLDQAQQWFEAALRLQSDYARAKSALGGVQRKRAELLEPAARLQPPNDLQQAIDLQEQALADAQADRDPFVEAVVGAALAKSYRLMGETTYLLAQDDQAAPWLERAAAAAGQAAAVLAEHRAYRLVAQAYESQGAAYLQLADIRRGAGDPAAAAERARRAIAAYESCIAQGEQARFDDFLQGQVIAPAAEGTPLSAAAGTATAATPAPLRGCQAGLQAANSLLRQIQGAQP